jgi:hypothetical protein
MLRARKIKEDEYRKKSEDEICAEERNERVRIAIVFDSMWRLMVSIQRLRREINVWGALKHRNICELIGFADDNHDYRVMVSPVGSVLPGFH